ncbi:hypothetical protein BCR43DRAFT_543258 [Syncephalastrum racemosum]|uniref:Periplasmic binding protein domain-containing protein n=1 Tax=Syncephalastrum racemosum TaxID=13706 RepID=A0A1X2HHM0_SYNRA|nr:hypothetical protein BCR43DRAFT_543258 [Syncephalastrum racemosum]
MRATLDGEERVDDKPISLPPCNRSYALSASSTEKQKDRTRIVVISHDSAMETFFHSPEQGARDASAILDIGFEWNRHLINSGQKMTTDIRNAVDSNADGIIMTIPNDEVFEAAKYALEKNIPVMVFNTGLNYAKELGLSRVLQEDDEAVTLLAHQLKARGYYKPLVLQLADLDDRAFEARYNSLRGVFGEAPVLLPLIDYNNTAQPMVRVRDTFLANKTYDCIVSLGGSIGVDIVSGAVLDILEKKKDTRVGAAFLDIGGNNMTALFSRHKDTIGISQLPYYQTALPVFYMYLRILTGYDVFSNETIKTGPNLVTNDTLHDILDSEQTTLLPLNDRTSVMGAILPNTRGKSYNSIVMAGVEDLARRLNWTAFNEIEDGPLGYPHQLRHELATYARQGVNGIILQSSDSSVLDYGASVANASEVPLARIGTFYEELHPSEKPQVF